MEAGPGSSSRGEREGADGIIYIVTLVRSESLSLSLARFVHQMRLAFSTGSSFVFHLSAFTCTYSYDQPSSSSLLYPPPPPAPCTVCLSCSSTTEFPFYALVKYFPWFYVLLFVRILLSGFSSCQRHFLALRYILRIVSFITEISDFSIVSSIASFLCLWTS